MGFQFSTPHPTGITLACTRTTHVMTAYKRSNLTVTDRVTVHEAAKRLGVSEGAVRQRLHRGKLKKETRPRFPSEGEGYVREPAVQPLSSASVVRGDTGQAFRKDRSAAGLMVAKEPSDMQANGDGDALPG